MQNSQNWFSLAELVAVIAIVGIIIFWAAQINYKPQIDNQNAALMVNGIYSSIETVRNNALLGKWFLEGWALVHPTLWTIKINTSWNGNIVWYYSTGWSDKKFDDFKSSFINDASRIRELRCWNPTKSSFSTGTNIDILIQGSTMTFSWCTAPNTAILDIKLRHANKFKTVRVNGVSWLIEKINQ